jgi:Zn finger protein HypA/HybF involved in hydrogenase expression
MPDRKPKTIECEACHRKGNPDFIWEHLCRGCAGKLRLIDGKASSIEGIRDDMVRSGIPIGRRRHE